MFKTRLLSGIVLVAVALLTIISGGYVLFFTVLLFHNRKQLMKAWSLLKQTGNRLPDLR